MATMSPTKTPPLSFPKSIPRGVSDNRHSNTLRSYNNKHQGKRGFLIGGGTSIVLLQQKGFDFSCLQNEVIVGVNKAYKLVLPTYLVFGDLVFWKEFYKEIQPLPCVKLAPEDIVKYHSDPGLLPLRRSNNYREVLPLGLDAAVSFINNSGVAALRILYCLGCNPIYLVGIDLGANANGDTHFHNDYTSLKRDTSKERYRCFLTEFVRTIAALKTKDISLFSCSEISPLNAIIPYVSLTSLF